MRHITDNKHEFNVRRVDELANELSVLEEKLKNTKGFLGRWKVNKEIRKINKQINAHAEEILIYENQKK